MTDIVERLRSFHLYGDLSWAQGKELAQEAAAEIERLRAAAVGAEAELLAFAEKHRLAISPQVNGGWVIERTIWGIDDGDEEELARTRGTLTEALRMAQAALTVRADVGAGDTSPEKSADTSVI